MDDSYSKYIKTSVLLQLVPPMIIDSLNKEKNFQENYDLVTDQVLSIGNPSVEFQRSELFNAARRLLSNMPDTDLFDKNRRKWTITSSGNADELPIVTLTSDAQCYRLLNLAVLSPDKDIRLRYLTQTSYRINLLIETQKKWSDILSERALTDDEVDMIAADFRYTPVECASIIKGESQNEKCIKISSLVPNSRRYFERLLNLPEENVSLHEYAENNGKHLFEELARWQFFDGFLYSLYLSSHSAITDEIPVDKISSEDFSKALIFLEKHGDRLSQVGAIEVGIRVYQSMPEIEPILIRLVELICGDDIDNQDSGYKLLAAAFLLVDGELSRIHLFDSKPPFYRRLAAFTQAALIACQLSGTGIDGNSFYEYAQDSRGIQYYLQSFVDMRLEPRWNPIYGTAEQLKAEHFGRIMIAADKYKSVIKKSKLYDLILENSNKNLKSINIYPCPYLPGPLEGGENNTNTLPSELDRAIRLQLNSENVTTSSFFALVNSALIYNIDIELANLAGEVLKRGMYRLSTCEETSQLLWVMSGLAYVAAISRSKDLSIELRAMVQRNRRDTQFPLSIQDAIWIYLISAASREDFNEWREYVGDCFSESAFDELSADEGETLLSYISHLLQAVPELWITCGRAEAALTAYNLRVHY